MAQTVWTILGLIRWAEERFRKEGIATPRLDAEILLAESLRTDRVGLYTHFDQPLKRDELARFKTLLLRRLRREPVAYILGRKEFWSLPFKVSRQVLIPRPETEILVSEALKILFQTNPDIGRIWEIGTGSGAISVALAKENPDARITATDISPEALSLAEHNALQNGVGRRIRFLQGDLFQPVQGERFEIILTNPPYIARGQFPSLMPEVRDFEPHTALDGGADGLDFFRRVLPEMGNFLEPGGWFLAEIGLGQTESILTMAEKNPDFHSFRFAKDLAGIDRVFLARKKE